MAKKKRSNSGKPTAAKPDIATVSGAGAATVNAPGALPAMGGGSDSGGKRSAADAAATARNQPSATTPAEKALPVEVVRGDWTVVIFALMMFFTPALGVPNEEMLQDTLKSTVVSFGVLGAALMFFWHQRNRREGLRWHLMLWPLIAMCLYALGSMFWSHTYLGGVEAVRWFILSLLMWLGVNTFSRDRLSTLSWGIHLGAVVASLWTALQFWVDFKYFPQGPNPASTFVNRNFFAEFVVCALPFSIMLLARARHSGVITVLAITTAFNTIAVLMTGTRSALVALMLLVPIAAITLFLYRRQFSFYSWNSGQRILAVGVLAASVIGMGTDPHG